MRLMENERHKFNLGFLNSKESFKAVLTNENSVNFIDFLSEDY
jgi:hypothetical protein